MVNGSVIAELSGWLRQHEWAGGINGVKEKLPADLD